MRYSFSDSLKNELSLFIYDRWLLAMVSIVPIVLMILMCSIFQNGAVRELPVAVVDMDNTSISRRLQRAIDAHPAMQVRSDYLSVQEAVSAMRNAEVYAVAYIGPKFTQRLIKQQSPSVDAFYNTQFVLVGRTLASSLQQVVATVSAGAAVARNLTHGETPTIKAFADSVPLRHQITPLYNMGSRYDLFLLTAIIPCLWQILMMVTMVLSYTAQHRKTGTRNWVAGAGLGGFVAKLLVYQLLFLAMGIGFLYYFYAYLQCPMHGSLSLLIGHQYLMIVATQAVASLVYFIVIEPARVLSISAAYVAPAFAFIGITFPANSMDLFPRIWRSILPITHYMRVQVTQINYGLPEIDISSQTQSLLLFLPIFVLVWLRARGIVKVSESETQHGEQL